MNWAELRDLVVALPEDSATKAALTGDVEGRRWDSSTYLAAAQYNASLMIARILWTAHLKGRPPEMEPIQPPRLQAHEEEAAEQALALERAEAYLDSFSPGRQPQDQTEVAELQAAIRELEARQ
jgi:hypothetical protein